ncbi:hypothetical protein LZ30DRAFT_729339 [Colletotrichum cereale]|nr:hypothetical protein LZ30DRAFT_729339 [Colletotrichum cereale]
MDGPGAPFRLLVDVGHSHVHYLSIFPFLGISHNQPQVSSLLPDLVWIARNRPSTFYLIFGYGRCVLCSIHPLWTKQTPASSEQHAIHHLTPPPSEVAICFTGINAPTRYCCQSVSKPSLPPPPHCSLPSKRQRVLRALPPRIDGVCVTPLNYEPASPYCIQSSISHLLLAHSLLFSSTSPHPLVPSLPLRFACD